MANKRISELSSRVPSASDLMLVGDPTTGYSYKCLVSQVGGVQSVFGRTGAVTAQEGDYTLTQLGDVTITSPQLDQILAYNGTTWVNTENYANKLQHYVKLAATIGKGKVVYVSGASGTNMLVSAASNDSEATSSKVLGVTASGGNTNDFVYVITEGLLPNIDTSAATIGDPVWLGTSGNLIFGLANRPVPPLNAVYIGVVTRVSATVGEIFIRVQNGFELDELHDVKFTSLSNNQAIIYNSTLSLWENRTLTTSIVTEGTNLYYTDARARGAISLTTTGSGAATYNSSTGVLNIPTPSSVNLYNSDGTLTGNRTVTMGGFNLIFSGGGQLRITATSGETFINRGSSAIATANTNSLAYAAVYNNAQTGFIALQQRDGTSARYGINGMSEIATSGTGGLAIISASGAIHFGTPSSEMMRIFTSGNIGINTTTDAGYRVDVLGAIRTSTELIAGTNATGGVRVGATSGSGSFLIRGYADVTNPGIEKVAANNTAMEFYQRGQGSNAYSWRFSSTDNNSRAMNVGVSGEADVIRVVTGIGLVNENNIRGNVIALRPVHDQTGSTRTGTIITGILYDPVLISLAGVSSHRALHTVSGDVLLATTSGSVGIGTTFPQSPLDVVTTGNSVATVRTTYALGAASASILAIGKTAASSDIQGAFQAIGGEETSVRLRAVSNHPITFWISTIERGRIFTSGNWGIGTTTDAGFKLDVNGSIRVQNSLTVGGSTTISGDVTGSLRIATETYFNAKGRSTIPGTRFASYGIGRPDVGFGSAVIGGMYGFFSGGSWVNGFGLAFYTSEGADISGGSLATEKMTIAANGSVGIGNTSPAASAILDITSTTRGVLLPRMTTTQRNAISSPATGLIVYDATNNNLDYYNGSQWLDVLASNFMTVDNTNTRLGINNSSPTSNLHVVGTGQISGNVLLAQSTAYVGIGTVVDTSYKLSVDGSVKATALRTAQPTGGVSVSDWKFGSTATGTFTMSTSLCVEVEIGGTLYKLATVS